eukprot:symbB.v1.2.033592.t1/scaffold4198.1/size43174/5
MVRDVSMLPKTPLVQDILIHNHASDFEGKMNFDEALGFSLDADELLPGVINQIGAENLMSLKRIAEGFSGGMEEKKDEDIPDIGENFEEVSKQ